LTYIYQQNKHAIEHKWVILSNPESADFSDVTGYLKVSITVSGAGDEPLELTEDPEPEKESFISPPTIKPEFYQIYLRFFAA